MSHRNSTSRIFAAFLALIMVFSMLPAGAMAVENGATIKGAQETVKVSAGLNARENNFNKGWKFNLGDNSSASSKNFDDSSWKNVDLPHDFSITQSYTSSGEAESGFLPGGTGWYRKSFTLDAAMDGKTFLLNFDGVYMHAYVYVNGTYVGEHHYGYTAFAFDITDHLVCDGATENVIAVKAVNNIPSSRWYSGSGIYRDVTLFAMDPVHVDLNGTKITTPNIASGNGTVNVAVDVVNDSDAQKSVSVKNTVYKKGNDTALVTAERTVTVAAGATVTAESSPVVSTPALWSVEAPNLYTVVTEVKVDGAVVDTASNDFGFRWFEFKSTGFYLNGKAVKLNGVCMHHDQGGLGSAAYYDAMYRQLSIMKDMGCNAIRTAHNPADEQYIEICNELGLLVIEEVFDGLDLSKNGNYNDFASHFHAAANSNLYGYTSGMTCSEYAARSTFKRDINAPAIIAWSMGNEIQQDSGSHASYVTIAGNFINWCNAVDGTRPVTIGDNTRGGDGNLRNVISTIVNAGGIAGYNYANSASTLKNLCDNYGGPKGVIIASETASATNSSGVYTTQASNSTNLYHQTSYDTSAVGWGITAHDSIYNTYQYDCVAGEFVWTGFDYLGEPTPFNGTGTGDGGRGMIPNSSYFGIVDTTGFEKDTYYLYRSQWNKNATTVHLVTAWDADNMMTSGGKTPVWLYSNAPKVELYRNGTKIATATRSERTSAAGHTYYTYTSTSNNTSVCSVTDGSGADALYAVFNVAYTAGTLTAKAYDANGNEIALNDSMGRYTVSTPGDVSKLKVTANKTTIAADGSSLAYVEVDVVDANGNLDTTATNNITFTLSGPGKILAVDNGDQATVKKYQQKSVLKSATEANINAYAGKALVIIGSTEDAGEIALTASATNMVGGTAYVNTVASGDSGAATGLVSYTMVRDYSVKAGTVPAMETAATGTMADGTTLNGTIAWNEIPADVYGTAGDYTVSGVLTFADMDPIQVSAKLHVIPNVIALRNVSTAVMEGNVPVLPNTVRGVLANGELAGEFTVTWNNIPTASECDVVGEIITVTGTATIFGVETMDVTCAVRVAEALNTESKNVARTADSLTQDIASGYQSDNLESIRNGTLKPGDNTRERWTNWNNRTRSADATLTLFWNTAVLLSHVNLYYYYDNCCAYPEAIEFSYSLGGDEYTVIGHTAQQVETYNLGAKYTYTFDEPINPIYLRVKLTQQGGTSGSHCVGLTELETMTYAASFERNTSADLSSITVDGTAVPGFAADTLAYETEYGTVAATTAVNAGITVLPAYEGVVRILTVSEDNSAAKTYAVTVGQAGCQHANTELRDAVAATCTDNGYTGDTLCVDCGEKTESGEVVPATGHKHTELRGAVAATCTSDGYTGDTWCKDCNTQIKTGSTIAAKEHDWDSGVITQVPTETQNGVKTYTCGTCGATKTETVIYQKELKTPSVSLTVDTNSNGRIVIKGTVDDYKNLSEYSEITAHGVLYITTSKIGARTLTVNSSGRTKVTFSQYDDEGSFTYNMKPTSKTTSYTMRAFVTYTDQKTGKSVTVYSDMVRGSYNTLK